MQKCKRILAVVLCLLMVAVYLPIYPAQTANAATVTTLESAAPTSYINGVSKVLLYEDDFSNKEDYVKAYGKSSKHLYWEAGRLSNPNTATGDSGVSSQVTFYGLSSSADAMQNYTVSADVTSMADGYMCVRAYGVYEFGIYQNKFRLYRRNGNNIQLGSSPTVVSYFSQADGFVAGTADGTPGSTVTVSIYATTVGTTTHLLCTATFNGVTKTIFDIDDAQNNTTVGAPGLITNTGGVNGKVAGYFYGVRVTADKADNGLLYSLNGTKKTLLYSDHFEDPAVYSRALGTGGTLTFGNGRLTYDDNSNHYQTQFKGLAGNSMQNYTISAEMVSKLDGGTYTDTVIGVVAYGKYEFSMYGPRIRLYRRSTTAQELMFGSTYGKELTSYFPDYVPGDKITLSLSASTVGTTVYLECYATHNGITKLLKSIEDTSGQVLSGAPCLLINKKDSAAYIDSVQVYTDSTESDTGVLYADSYTNSDGFGAAMGTTTSSIKHHNGSLLIDKNDGQETATFNGITNAATLTNYTISADFSFVEETRSLGGVSAYCASNGGKAFEYAIYQGKLRLYCRATNSHLFAATDINSWFPEYTVGDVIRLSLTAVTNDDGSVTLLCIATYAGETKFICSYTDNTAGISTCGAPGIRGGASADGIALDCTVDNMKVQTYTGDIEEEIYNIVGFDIDTILNVGSNQNSRNVNWQTAFDIDCVLEYTSKANLVEGEFPTASGSFVSVEATKNTKATSSGIAHKATMTDLVPDTEYVYRIRSGKRTSELYSFYNDGLDDGYSFSFMGDPQVGRIDGDVAQWEQTVDALTDNFDVDFMLSLGDEVHNPAPNWYGGFIADDLTGLTTATVIGNHDTAAMYSDFFNLPNVSDKYGITVPGSNYWFVYGNTLFMVLNSNNLSTAEHIAFMEEAIKANPDVVWKTVSMHHCIYSVSVHGEDENVLTLRQELVPAFTELGIDVVLMGHDHCYTRSYMMNGFEPDSANGAQSSVTDPTGILYITANSASGSKYNGIQLNSAPYAAVFGQSGRRTFAVVEVTDTKFDIVTYFADDLSVMDRFTINKTAKTEPEFKISSASITLQSDLSVNYKVNSALFAGEQAQYANPYMVFEMNGKTTTVTNYNVVGDRYIFSFTDVAPDRMNDTISATLYATKNGETVSVEKTYSIAEYCYYMLDYYAQGEDYAELRTLLVDLLQYGANAQAYTGHNQENPVTAALTETQLAWGTTTVPTLSTAFNKDYATVENATATWKSAGLWLEDSITLRFGLEAESIEGLTVKMVCGTNAWTVDADDFVAQTQANRYYVYFDQLHAGQMSETVYVTVYNGQQAVSNTLAYSIESYAYEKQSDTDAHLVALVNAMMNYGNSAYAYVN